MSAASLLTILPTLATPGSPLPFLYPRTLFQKRSFPLNVWFFPEDCPVRCYVAFDVLVKVIRDGLNLRVKYARNVTDVDDKIIARASRESRTEAEVAQQFHAEFAHDMRQLNCHQPDIEPKATEHMDAIISMIASLEHRGYAYASSNGDVYFSVSSFSEYGSLTGRMAGTEDEGGNEESTSPSESLKHHSSDFALWKSSKAGEPAWSSPWGDGRPGWHIECSAMVHAALGVPVDVHGGGKDLLFPHHENELAQGVASGVCDCALHTTERDPAHAMFARVWAHNGFVRDASGEKMAKSIGNTSSVRDICKRFHPLALRLTLLSTHYRADVAIGDEKLHQASERIFYMLQTLKECNDAIASLSSLDNEESDAKGRAHEALQSAQTAIDECDRALADDMNTPAALSALSEPLAGANALLHGKKKERQAQGRRKALQVVSDAMQHVLSLTGLLRNSQASGENDSEPELTLHELRSYALHRSGFESESELLDLIAERTQARNDKDFKRADAIREQLSVCGIFLMDTPTGDTHWRPGIPLGSHVEEKAAQEGEVGSEETASVLR